ncbi:MAG TPA: hypothetical protein VF480_01365, partial [Verrucomicrobiae bacterium]
RITKTTAFFNAPDVPSCGGSASIAVGIASAKNPQKSRLNFMSLFYRAKNNRATRPRFTASK